MNDDAQRQLASIGKGLVQLNLRVSRITELLERGGQGAASPARGEPDELLFDLLEAVERTLQAPLLPAPPAPWWKRLLAVSTPTADLEGLALARDHVRAALGRQGIQPTPASGRVDPQLHRVIATRPTDDPQLAEGIAEVHQHGWFRAGSPPTVLRLAQVTTWKAPET